METRPTGREDTISSLNAAIAILNLAQKNSKIATARAIFRSATNLLTATRVRSSLFRDNRIQAHSWLELDSNGQRAGFH